ncbi:hypothetical protein [Salininema proteolyticum]|uniref:Uncharacterized protein n=1 Tax=Salininema proteolyticum TaxID=1607685 RepID=A0ABV8TUX1_9ACTN
MTRTRRLALFSATVVGGLSVASPAMAFQHDRVSSPALHWFLDIASLLIVAAPVVTALAWGRGQNRWLMAALIGIVQVPVAVLAFAPGVSHAMKGYGLAVGLTVTALAVLYTRRAAALQRASEAEQESSA